MCKYETVTIENFENFRDNYSRFYPWLREENMDVGGGTISIEDIDKIKDYPDAEVVTISGLQQDTFEYFIKTYGHQFKAIRFHKNKLVEDWSLLGELPSLEFVHWFFNQRITSFWDMSKNASLKAISIDDFSRINGFEMIDTAPALEFLSIGAAVWPSNFAFDSFAPLINSKVRKLEFYRLKIPTRDFSFVLNMPQLQEFDFPSNLLTTEQYAWIVANRPDLKGWSLCAAYIRTDYDGEAEKKRVLVIGKGKREFDLKGNEKRLEKIEREFQALIKKYRGMPYPI